MTGLAFLVGVLVGVLLIHSIGVLVRAYRRAFPRDYRPDPLPWDKIPLDVGTTCCVCNQSVTDGQSIKLHKRSGRVSHIWCRGLA